MSTESSTKVALRSLVAPVTLLLLFANVGIYILQLIFGWEGRNAAFWPIAIVHDLQIYRIFTNVFFHGSVLHFFLDCIPLWYLSARIERQFGSISHFMGTVMSIVLASGIHLLLAWAVDIIFDNDKYMNQLSIGFGGVLFYYLVLECFALEGPTRRKLCGVIPVPTFLFPFAVLTLVEVLIPDSDWLGGLSGILTGFVKHFHLLPFSTFGPAWDDWACFAWMKRSWPGFVPAPAINNENEATPQPESSISDMNSQWPGFVPAPAINNENEATPQPESSVSDMNSPEGNSNTADNQWASIEITGSSLV